MSREVQGSAGAPPAVARGSCPRSRGISVKPAGRGNYDSLGSLVSSMIMSLNSLDSNISPHSLHSTNSESSSRATIWTRGCLHGVMLLFLSGSSDGEDGVINPGAGSLSTAGDFAGNWRYFRPPSPDVKSLRDLWLLSRYAVGRPLQQEIERTGVTQPKGVSAHSVAARCGFATVACKGLHLSRLPSNIYISD